MDDYISHRSSDDQKYAIEKYLYKEYWKIDELTEDFLDMWFRKTYILDNIKSLLEEKELNNIMTIDKFNKNNYLVHEKDIHKERTDIIKELIETIGFDLEDIGNNLILDRETFVENMEKSVKNCKIFKDVIDCEFLFGVKSKQVKTVKAFIGFVNSIFKNWGLNINFIKTAMRDTQTKKFMNIYTYSLSYYQNINDYL
jgi:hypothetical protein